MAAKGLNVIPFYESAKRVCYATSEDWGHLREMKEQLEAEDFGFTPCSPCQFFFPKNSKWPPKN